MIQAVSGLRWVIAIGISEGFKVLHAICRVGVFDLEGGTIFALDIGDF